MSEVQVGDVVCKAGRGVKCAHKRNAFFSTGGKGNICAISATSELCKFGGDELASKGSLKKKVVSP